MAVISFTVTGTRASAWRSLRLVMPAYRQSAPAKPVIGSAPRTLDWAVIAGAMAILVLTFLAYANSFGVPLLFDDIPAIAQNVTLRQWATTLRPPIDTTVGGRPFLNLSLALNYAMSGTAVWSYHAVNLAIHMVSGFVLFGLLRRTPTPLLRGSPWIAFSAALLWCLHPLHTEAVTYVVQRAESLMGLLYLITLYCFVRGAALEQRLWSVWFSLSIVACALGMATKEVMVSAPVIVLLYDRTFLAGTFGQALRERGKIFIGFGATWLILIFLTLSAHGRGGSAGFGSGVAWGDYLLTQFAALTRYLVLCIWPHPLVFYYGTEWVAQPWSIFPAALVVLGLVAATGWALCASSSRVKQLGFCGAWFFAILAPTSVVPIVRQTMAEHRLYLALIPVVVVAVVRIHGWLGRLAAPSLLAVAGVFLGLTVKRNGDYQSALSIWTDTVAKRPENAYARYNLGLALEEQPERSDEVMLQYREALRLKPDLIEAHTNLGKMLFAHQKTAEAIAELESALRLGPNSAEAHNNLGYALARTPGRLVEATGLFETAVRLKPSYAEAYCNLGGAWAAAGRIDDAISAYETALRLRPEYAAAHYNLGNALAKLPSRLPEAVAHFEAAVRAQPNFVEAHFNLAVLLIQQSERLEEAQSHLKTVLQLQPGNQTARRILTQLNGTQGQ